MPDITDGSAHLDGLAQDAPDAPREQQVPSATLDEAAFTAAMFGSAEEISDGIVNGVTYLPEVVERAPSLPDA